MTRRSFRYMAIALGVVALLGMSLVHFRFFCCGSKQQRKPARYRRVSQQKLTTVGAARATDRGTKDRL